MGLVLPALFSVRVCHHCNGPRRTHRLCDRSLSSVSCIAFMGRGAHHGVRCASPPYYQGSVGSTAGAAFRVYNCRNGAYSLPSLCISVLNSAYLIRSSRLSYVWRSLFRGSAWTGETPSLASCRRRRSCSLARFIPVSLLYL